MTTSVVPVPRTMHGKALGVLAVVGLVVAFSLSSTLVKRAESPGVLVAFWRMALVSVFWHAYLAATGRRVTVADVRQAVVPALFFGANLAAFFVGATHNSVANAALIGSLSPLLIVPLGAVLFVERHRHGALAFAVVALGGVGIVLTSAPVRGDASARGNALGLLAMVLWAGYVASSRWFRREMDVPTFMATVCPIAALALLPLALATEGSLHLSRTGWAWTLVMTALTGIAGHGLLVYAQRTVQIGSIGVSQVIQPALAVVWSFLLLREQLSAGQGLGIAVAVGGLLAFVRIDRPREEAAPAPAVPAPRQAPARPG